MKFFSLVLILTAAAAFAQAGGTSKTDGIVFTTQTLDYPGANFSRAVGINNSGTISGTFRVTPPQRPYLLKNGQYQTVDAVPPGFAQGWGINDNGDTVGLYSTDDGIQHGYLLTSDGGFTDLAYPGAVETDPVGINNSGVVVGEFSLDEDTFHCFIYSNGQFQQFDVPGARDTVCLGVNSRGDISGDWDTDINTAGHGFVLRDGQVTSFDHPDALPDSTEMTGINDRGDVLGAYLSFAGLKFFVRLANGLFQDIPVPADATAGGPWGINNARQIVGNYLVGTVRHAFFAAPEGTAKPF